MCGDVQTGKSNTKSKPHFRNLRQQHFTDDLGNNSYSDIIRIYFFNSSWSPDGQFISAAHAFSGPNHVAMIVARDTWKTVCDFVGHKLPVVVARFNPVISFLKYLSYLLSFDPFELFSDREGTKYGVCLLGGQDSTISVWTTNTNRPLVAAQMLFTQSVLDISNPTI